MKDDSKNILVTVGTLGSTYGVHGWIKVQSYTEFGADILSYSPWYLANDLNRPVNIEDEKMHGKQVLVKFAGVDTPEAARLLTGTTISIKRSQLPRLTKNEYYWSDLEGLTVITEKGEILGKVIYLLATGSNDVLIVKGEKEQGIPYLPDKVIKKVDLVAKQIIVDWEPL